MEKTITRVVKKSLVSKYPFFDDVEVTKEKNHRSYFTDEEKKTFKIKHILKGQNETDKYIFFNNLPIFRCYPGYTNDRNSFTPKQHYSILWNQKRIYL